MNQIIKIEKREGRQAVNARELHEFLQSKQDFSNWIKNRIEKFDFIEGEDFSINLSKSAGGRPNKEYYISVEMGKELAMIENNDRGRQARRYFIECEKKAKAVYIPETYSEALQLAADLAKENENKERQLEDLRPKGEFFDRVIKTDTLTSMRDVAAVLNYPKMGRNNLYKFLRENEILSYDNIPYRRYIEAGYFVVKERIREINGEESIYFVTLVTQKGVEYIKKKLDEKNIK